MGAELPYRPADGWAGLLGAGVDFGGDAAAVGIASDGRVVVFSRGPKPVMVFAADGSLVHAWGEGRFACAHGMTIFDDELYLVDSRGGHAVHKYTLDGTRLLTIGEPGHPAVAHSGQPFNSPTDVFVHPVTRDLFVTDGYDNSAVHRFDPSGRHIASWGRPGGDPGEFYLPHAIEGIGDDLLVVADRENFRLQLFTLDGDFVDQWRAFRPSALAVHDGFLYVAELGPTPRFWGQPRLGSRISVLSFDGELVGRLGADRPGLGAGSLWAPHSLAFDDSGALYLAEVSRTWSRDYLGLGEESSEPLTVKKWDHVS
jgi:hypothetical protein